MNCYSCGKKISHKGIEGTDFLKDKKSNWWCIECAKNRLSRWTEFEALEKLAENAKPYREALIDTLRWAINEGYCVRPRERCQASAEKCLKCWLNHLVGETEE